MKDTTKIIRAAGRLLKNRNNRARGWFAKTRKGDHCGVSDRSACSWCLAGAIYKQAKSINGDESFGALAKIKRFIKTDDITRYWDKAPLERQDRLAEKMANFTDADLPQ